MEGNKSPTKRKNSPLPSFPEHLNDVGDSQNNNAISKQSETLLLDSHTVQSLTKASNDTGSIKSKNDDSDDNERLSGKDASGSKASHSEIEKFPDADNNFDRLEKMQIEKSIGSRSPSLDKEDDDNFMELENEPVERKRLRKVKVDAQDQSPLISPELSPSIHEMEIDKFKPNLRELKGDGKFKISNKELSIEEKKERYKELIYTYVNEEDMACLICLDGEAFTNDDLFQCDLCNSAFHQSCFGSELIDIQADDDQAEWFCHRCSYLLEFDLPFSAIRCEFCPELKGAIKRIKQKSDKKWGHVNCVNWIPEIYYEDGIEKQNVFIDQYWKRKSAGRKQLTCDFCKIKYGDCIKCDGEKCAFTFHVICGQIYGLIACWKDMQTGKRENDEEYYLPIYCKSHMKAYRKDMYDFSNKIERKNQNQLSYISYFHYQDASSTPSRKKETKKRREIDQYPESAKTTRRLKSSESPPPIEIETKKSLTTPRKSLPTQPESESSENKRSLRPRKSVATAGKENENKISEFTLEELTPEKEENKRSLRSRNSGSKEASATKQLSSSQTPEKKQITSNRELPLVKNSSPAIQSSTSRTRSGNKDITMDYEEAPQPFSIKARKRGTFVEPVASPAPITSIATRPAKKSVSKEDTTLGGIRADGEASKKPDQNDNDSDSSSLMPDKETTEEEKNQKLYKMKPDLASVIKFYEWTTEKEIKQEIQKYIRQKNLYNKKKKEVEVHKDRELAKVLGISTIARLDIFKKFLPFMYEKKPELMAIRDDEDLPFCALYAKEAQKMREEKQREKEKEAAEKAAPKKPAPVTRSAANKVVKEQKPPLNKQNGPSTKPKSTPSSDTKTNQKVIGQSPSLSAKKDVVTHKEATTSQTPAPTAKKTDETKPQEGVNGNSLNSKREGATLFDILNKGDDIYPAKKVKPNSTLRTNEVPNDTSTSFLDSIFKSSSDNKPESPKDINDEVFASIIKGDQFTLRKTMAWFTPSENDSLIDESISSPEVIKLLWPKGAEVLF